MTGMGFTRHCHEPSHHQNHVKSPTKIDSSSPQVGQSQKQKPLKKRIVNSPNFLDGLITSQNTMLQPQKSNVQVNISCLLLSFLLFWSSMTGA